jgi:DNA polymerase III subunit gamma/tau
MTASLALRYRPRTFADIVGQPPVTAVLYRMSYLRRLPAALLFSGCRGAGKTSTARILGAALNCERERGSASEWPCTACPSCEAVAEGSSLDVLEIDAASNGGVAEVERIRDRLQYVSANAATVVVLDEAHSMSRPAFNSLLKMLEEPPGGVTFVLLTTEPGKILPTVASRCTPFSFRRLPAAVIAGRLEYVCAQEGITAEPALLRLIAEHADGAMRDALVALDQLVRVGITDLAHYQALTGDTDFAPGLVEACAAGNPAQLFSRLDAVLRENADYDMISARLVACLRDILVLLGKGTIPAEGEGLAARQRLAASLDIPRVARAMQVLWDLRVRAGKTEPRSALELACAMCLEKLAAPHPPGNGHNGHHPLDISQLRAMAV